MGFSRQEYWSGLPCPPPEDLPHPGVEPASLMSLALTGRFFTTNATWESQDAMPAAHRRVCEGLRSASTCFAAGETTNQSWTEWGRESNLPWPPFFAFREWVDVGAVYLVDTWIGSLSLHLNIHQFRLQQAEVYVAQISLQPAFHMWISFSQLDIFSRDLESIRWDRSHLPVAIAAGRQDLQAVNSGTSDWSDSSFRHQVTLFMNQR